MLNGIYKTGSMKRVLIYLLGAVIIVAAIFVYLFFRPDIAARVFFGAAPSPVEMNLRRVYSVPAADKKTVAIVAAARLFLSGLTGRQSETSGDISIYR